MLYTTYFARLRTLPPEITPVAICGKAPDWYAGLQYKKLAPRRSFFSVWRQTRDSHYYVEHFNTEVLTQLNARSVYDELTRLTGSTEIALVCYERPEQFCHRHLVANWFRENGIEIKEYGC